MESSDEKDPFTSFNIDSSSSDDDEFWGEEDEEWEGEEDDEELLHAMAEQAKEEARRKLRELKAVFRVIKQRNNEIPEAFRIPESNLQLPSEIYDQVYKSILHECEEAYKTHEQESVERIVQLEKIEKFYFSPIKVPHFVVKDITHEMQVHTIRSKKVTEEFQNLVKENEKLLQEESYVKSATASIDYDEELQTSEPEVRRIIAKDVIGDYESKLELYDMSTQHSIKKLEDRLAKKYTRDLAWQDLMSKKIPSDYIAPSDEEKLQRAQEESQSFQLKTSENYVGDKLTIPQKRQYILNMKMDIRAKIDAFNKLVIEARDEKPNIIKECRKLEKEIRKIHILLPEEYRRKIPKIFDMEPEETLDRVLDITQEDIEAEETRLVNEEGLQGVKESIAEDFYGAPKPTKHITLDDYMTYTLPESSTANSTKLPKSIDLEYETLSSYRCRLANFTSTTEFDKKKFYVKFYPSLYKQEGLFNELYQIINYYHERIKYLHDYRVRLEVELKVKAVAMLSMIAELDLSKELGSQENATIERLRAQEAECRNVRRQLEKAKKTMQKIQGNIKRYEQEIQSIFKEAENIITNKGKTDYLWRLFKRKVKVESPPTPQKDIQGPEEEEDDGEEEEEELLNNAESSSSTSSSTSHDPNTGVLKSSKQKYDFGVCPDNVDKIAYNKICELRQQRATVEGEIEKCNIQMEKLSTECQEREMLYQTLQERLTDISDEIRVLHRRRQKLFNDMNAVIILRADQIQCMDLDELAELEGETLEKLAEAYPGTKKICIFPKGGTLGLEERAYELAKMAKEEREKNKQGRKMLNKLKEELRRAEVHVDNLKHQVKEEMILKFGKKVDLDQISAIGINLDVLDQEIKLEQLRKQQYKERQSMDDDLEETKEELTEEIKENTKLNMMKAVMMERRRDFEYFLWKHDVTTRKKSFEYSEEDTEFNPITMMNSSDYSTTEESSETRRKKIEFDEEMKQSQKILHLQQDRIRSLQQVLNQCRSKSGLPPIIKLIEEIKCESSGENAKFTRTTRQDKELNAKACPTTRTPWDCLPKVKLQPTPASTVQKDRPTVSSSSSSKHIEEETVLEKTQRISKMITQMQSSHRLISENLPDEIDPDEFADFVDSVNLENIENELFNPSMYGLQVDEADGEYEPADADKYNQPATQKSALNLSLKTMDVPDDIVRRKIKRMSIPEQIKEERQLKRLEYLSREEQQAVEAKRNGRPSIEDPEKLLNTGLEGNQDEEEMGASKT